MKKCFKCQQIKKLDDFYKHKQMADGHLNKCKECNKLDVRLNREKNIDYYKDYDSWRFQNDPRVKERLKRYSKTENYKLSCIKSKNNWQENNPEKRAAHVILGNAVRSGRISKPDKCSFCGNITLSRKLHAHHHDYTKPIDVTWLCAQCHSDRHRKRELP